MQSSGKSGTFTRIHSRGQQAALFFTKKEKRKKLSAHLLCRILLFPAERVRGRAVLTAGPQAQVLPRESCGNINPNPIRGKDSLTAAVPKENPTELQQTPAVFRKTAAP